MNVASPHQFPGQAWASTIRREGDMWLGTRTPRLRCAHSTMTIHFVNILFMA